jgi:hypothetical protein
MNVLVVGLLCIAVYAVVLAAWLRIDVNRSDYTARNREAGR